MAAAPPDAPRPDAPLDIEEGVGPPDAPPMGDAPPPPMGDAPPLLGALPAERKERKEEAEIEGEDTPVEVPLLVEEQRRKKLHEKRQKLIEETREFVRKRYAELSLLGPDPKPVLIKELEERINKLSKNKVRGTEKANNLNGKILEFQQDIRTSQREVGYEAAGLTERHRKVGKKCEECNRLIAFLKKKKTNSERGRGEFSARDREQLAEQEDRAKKLEEEITTILGSIGAQTKRLVEDEIEIEIPTSEDDITKTRKFKVQGGLKGALQFLLDRESLIKSKGLIFEAAIKNLKAGRDPFVEGKKVAEEKKVVEDRVVAGGAPPARMDMASYKRLLTVRSCQFNRDGQFDLMRLPEFRKAMFHFVGTPGALTAMARNSFRTKLGAEDDPDKDHAEFLSDIAQLLSLGVLTMAQINTLLGFDDFVKHIQDNIVKPFNTSEKAVNIMYYKQDMRGADNPKILQMLKEYLFLEPEMSDANFQKMFAECIKKGEVSAREINSVININIDPDLDPPFDIETAIVNMDRRLVEEREERKRAAEVKEVKEGAEDKKRAEEVRPLEAGGLLGAELKRLGDGEVRAPGRRRDEDALLELVGAPMLGYLTNLRLRRAEAQLAEDRKLVVELREQVARLDRDRIIAVEAARAAAEREERIAREHKEAEEKLKRELERASLPGGGEGGAPGGPPRGKGNKRF